MIEANQPLQHPAIRPDRLLETKVNPEDSWSSDTKYRWKSCRKASASITSLF